MIKLLLKKYLYIPLILAISIAVTIPLLKPGYYPMHDDFQVIRTYEIDKCLSDGQFPCRWVPDMGFGYGYPEFNYYAPLPYYFMSLIHMAGVSYIDSVKVLIVVTTFFSGLGMYLLAKYLWKSEMAGYVSTLLYLYLPYRAVDIYVRGAIPEIAAMAFTPFIFFFAAQTIEGKKYSKFWLAISLALLFLSHNITTLIVTPVFAIWTLFLIIQKRDPKKIIDIAVSFITGLGLASFFHLPAFFEKSYVQIETMTSGYFNYLAHFVNLPQILFSNTWGYGMSFAGSGDSMFLGIGWLHWIMPIVALLVILLTKKFKYLTYLALFIIIGWLALFMVHEKSSFIWSAVPLLSFIQFPWRIFLVAGFCFSLASGGVMHLGNKYFKVVITALIIGLTIYFYGSFFKPNGWIMVTDSEKLTGSEWTKSITTSLYDYLPVSAKKGPDFEANKYPLIKEGSANVLTGEKGSNWQNWTIDSITDLSKIELQLYYFPNWIVKVDGKPVIVDYSATNGLMTIILNKGVHEVDARLYDTNLRIFANSISLLSIAPLVYFVIKRK